MSKAAREAAVDRPSDGTLPFPLEFKKRKAKARWTRKQAKRGTWMKYVFSVNNFVSAKKYVSSVNSFVTTKDVWDRYRKIKGITVHL